ncbi:MAG: YlxR family protein [Acidimicrobiales bacterium]
MGPVRSCVGCRRRAPADELVRVVRVPDGGLAVGRTLPGRGAWLCRNPDCLSKAVRARALERALRAPLRAGAAEELRRELGPVADVRGWMDTRGPSRGT